MSVGLSSTARHAGGIAGDLRRQGKKTAQRSCNISGAGREEATFSTLERDGAKEKQSKAPSPLTRGRRQGLAHVARCLLRCTQPQHSFSQASRTLSFSSFEAHHLSQSLSSCTTRAPRRALSVHRLHVAAMAATRSSPSTSTPSSLASRRPQARTALPPFTLPPQPGVPRAAADTLSPPTPASAYGSTPRQSSASPSYSAESSPGYSTGTTMLAHPHRAASHSPYQSHHPLPAGGAAVQPRRLAPRPGPLTHPHDPKVTSIAITNAIANTAGISANRDTAAGVDVSGSTSPRSPSTRRPLPGAPGETSPTRPVQRLPPISSLISPLDRAGLGRVRIMVCPFVPGPHKSLVANVPRSTSGLGNAPCGQHPCNSRCRR